MLRIPFNDLVAEFNRVLLSAGLPSERAERTAQLFAENTRDGVTSHGINRFPSFIRSVENGTVDPHAEAECVATFGVLEQWDGKGGIGLLNAEVAMGRAVDIAKEHGMGCVGLRNTNHWMRAGAYGLQAADAGCIGICWTNTTVLMPPWGAKKQRIGNNPMVICVPRPDGHILLDMAMSQYANGKLEVMKRRGEQMPLPGGYDHDGNLTADPGAILETRRAIPIGYWKGSGLALILDLMAAVLSGGDSTHEIGARSHETAVSQVYIAIDTAPLSGSAEKIDAVIHDFLGAEPLDGVDRVRYPGEGMLATRKDSLENGVAIDDTLWEDIRGM